MVKNPIANAGDIRDTGLIPGSERSPGGEHGNLLQYFCLKNPTHRGAWQAMVHWVTKSRTWLKQISTHSTQLIFRWEHIGIEMWPTVYLWQFHITKKNNVLQVRKWILVLAIPVNPLWLCQLTYLSHHFLS